VFAYVQGGGPGQGSGSGLANAGAVVGPDSVLLIDTMYAPLHINGMLTALRPHAGDRRVTRVINTHHHGDHVGNNSYFRDAEIVGHEYCREAVLALKWPATWEKRAGWAEGGEPRTVVAPNTTMTDKVTYRYGDTVVEVFFLGVAHTWGDVYVHLPQHKVLFVGDVGCHYVVPFAHQGQVTLWLDVLDKILALDVDVIVPGHGPIGGKRELAEMGEYLRVLKAEARKRFDAGMSPGRAAAEIRLGKFDNWIGSERVLLNTFRLYNEFNGTLTPLLDIPGIRKAADEYHSIKGVPPPSPAQ
jgi:glyoxylase-like metal-dependent hydrolase (beta-lactamase superfamily II)